MAGALLASCIGSNAFARIDPLARWRTAVASRATSPAKLMVIGDSISEGQGASARTSRWQDLLLTSLRSSSSISGGGIGYLQSVNGVYTPDSGWAHDLITAASNSTFVFDNAPGQYGSIGTHAIEFPAGAWATWTFTGTDVEYWYVSGVAGSFTWAIDGGAATTVTVGSTYASNNRVTITGLTAGAHTLRVTAVTATHYSAGLMIFNGDRAAGILRYDNAATSAKISSFTGAGQTWIDAINTASPDLLTVMIGTNDASTSGAVPSATYQTSLTAWITQLQALAKVPSILLIAAYQTTMGYTEPWQNYVAVMRAVAASKNLAFLDLTTVMPTADTTGTGLYSSDGIHPNNTGHAQLAGYVGSALGVT